MAKKIGQILVEEDLKRATPSVLMVKGQIGWIEVFTQEASWSTKLGVFRTIINVLDPISIWFWAKFQPLAKLRICIVVKICY